MTRWTRKTRTFKEARAILAERYEEQASLFPTMRVTTPKGVYIAMNLRAAQTYYTQED
jgi:hypothetical protein